MADDGEGRMQGLLVVSGRMQRVLARVAVRGRDIPTARGAAAEEGMGMWVQTRWRGGERGVELQAVR